jgi:hypothetical protein
MIVPLDPDQTVPKPTYSLGLPTDPSRTTFAITPSNPVSKRDGYIKSKPEMFHFHAENPNSQPTLKKSQALIERHTGVFTSPKRDTVSRRRPSPPPKSVARSEAKVGDLIAGRASPTTYHDLHAPLRGTPAVFAHEERPFVGRGRDRTSSNSTYDLLAPAPSTEPVKTVTKTPGWLTSSQMSERLALKDSTAKCNDAVNIFMEKGRAKVVREFVYSRTPSKSAGIARTEIDKRGGDTPVTGKKTDERRGKDSCKNVFESNHYPKIMDDGVGKVMRFQPVKRVNADRGKSQIVL